MWRILIISTLLFVLVENCNVRQLEIYRLNTQAVASLNEENYVKVNFEIWSKMICHLTPMNKDLSPIDINALSFYKKRQMSQNASHLKILLHSKYDRDKTLTA